MKRLTLILLLSGCAQGAQKDLPYIKQARSAAAEWALVNDQAAQDKLTRPYVEAMRDAAREEIKTAASGLSDPSSPQAREIKALIAEAPNAPAQRLRAHVARLKQLEDSLESA